MMLTTAAEDKVTLHYRPLAKCAGAIVGFEAVTRWHHRRRSQISPEAFIPIFEENGLALSLSHWALRQACSDAASWHQPLQVLLSLSAIQLRERDLSRLVGSVLTETGLAPERLELEVTEAALSANPNSSATILSGLRELGIHVVLDDFGLGVFPTAFLNQFPLTMIKVDRQFAANIATSAAAQSVLHMTIELGHYRDLIVAADGVETPDQLAFLRDEGCDLVQGLLIGPPAPISDFAASTGNTAAKPGRHGPPTPTSEWAVPVSPNPPSSFGDAT